MFPEQLTQIGTLNLKRCNGHTLTTRLMINKLFNQVDWHPAGLSPSAILIINEFLEPMVIDFDTPTPMILNKSSWSRTCQQKIIDHYSRAARPSRGAIPSNCEAVVFTDIGEMLACYLLDVSTHQAQDRWWWREVIRRWQPGENGVLERIIAQNIRYLPASFGHLTNWGQIQPVLRSLSPDSAARLLSALVQEFGGSSQNLEDLVQKQESEQRIVKSRERTHKQDHRVSPGRDHTRKRIGTQSHGEHPDIDLKQIIPWDCWIPDTVDFHSLKKQQAFLLVTALIIKNRPGILHESSFIESLNKFWEQKDFSKQNKEAAIHAQDQGRSFEFRPDEQKKIIKEITQDDGRVLHKPDQYAGNEMQPQANVEITEMSVEKDSPTNQVLPSGISETEQENKYTTHIGGILYLINLMKQLHLPECFDKDWQLSTQLGAWGILNLIGRGLMGIEGDSFIDDPIWDMFAWLAGGNPEKLPGESFTGTDRYQLPASWWDATSGEQGPLNWTISGETLQIWEEDGFLLLEYPKKDDIQTGEIQVKKGLENYFRENGFHETNLHRTLARKKSSQAPHDKLEGQLTMGLNPDLKWWLARVLPAIRYQLQNLLQQRNGDFLDLTEFFRVPGKIFATDTHIDLVASLENISLPIRQAGLDIDPGWVPDFGRVVKFHFQ